MQIYGALCMEFFIVSKGSCTDCFVRFEGLGFGV